MVGAVKDANLGERASKMRLPEMRKQADGHRGRATPVAATTKTPAWPASSASATLHEKGILTDEEFAAEKSRVLGDDTAAG